MGAVERAVFRGSIAAKGEHVLHTSGLVLGDALLEPFPRERNAGKVRHRADAELALEHRGDGGGLGEIAAPAGRTGDADEVWPVGAQLLCRVAGLVEGELPLGREHLERNGDLACCVGFGKDVVNVHGSPFGRGARIVALSSVMRRAVPRGQRVPAGPAARCAAAEVALPSWRAAQCRRSNARATHPACQRQRPACRRDDGYC